MKQNMLIILLTAVAVLLLVNLLQDRIPPTAQAGTNSIWNMVCAEKHGCYVIGPRGHITWLYTGEVRSIGSVK